jgi:hypothetical protein
VATVLTYTAAFGIAVIVFVISLLATRRASIQKRAAVSCLSFFISFGLCGIAAHELFPRPVSPQRIPDTRSEAQKQFDAASDDFAESRPENGNFIESLRARAAKLDASDGRHVDLAVLIALGAPEPERRPQLEAILAAGKHGIAYGLDDVARTLLFGIYRSTNRQPLDQRISALEDGIAGVMRIAPDAFGGTVAARLQQARLIDESGDQQRAGRLLEELQARAQGLMARKPSLLESIGHERVWFHLSHGEPDAALRILKEPQFAGLVANPLNTLASDHAWALIIAGRFEEGADRMRLASYAPPRELSAAQRLLGVRAPVPLLVRPLDMAHALVEAGKLTEASSVATSAACKALGRGRATGWQKLKNDLLKRTAILVCPLEEPYTAKS